MKHLRRGRKLSRPKDQRKALHKMMVGSLLLRRKISTTEAKAKEIKRIGEKIISDIRKAFSEEEAKRIYFLRKISARVPKNIKPADLKEIAQYFSGRKGGYLSISKMNPRFSDGARLAMVQFIEREK